jgi:hypothetical protein
MREEGQGVSDDDDVSRCSGDDDRHVFRSDAPLDSVGLDGAATGVF